MNSWSRSQQSTSAACLLVLVALLPLCGLRAASLESLVMPGPVAQAHADLEETCSNCHDAFDRDAQKTLCLDCHEPVAEDLASMTGFHGRYPDVAAVECSQCHGEHLGREADITGLVVDVFDHQWTDFPLTRSHTEPSCRACHEKGDGFRLEETSCVSCHDADDAHDGGLGEDCAACHQEDNWRTGSFDHSTTDFSLLGRHEEVRCASCHQANEFEDTSKQCVSCHRQDDVHDGGRGDDCAECHDSRSWSAQFDHLAISGFALLGAHADLFCASCHLSAPTATSSPLPEDCQGCHGGDDVHLGGNGTACGDCHSESSWQLTFDHFEETGYRLEGTHQDLSCNNCHTGKLTDQLPTDCWGCHELDDPHNAALVECDDCHGQSRFLENLTFNHDLASFALVGLHRTVSCEQCHASLEYSPTDAQCSDCHGEEDPHDGSLGALCGDCHNPVGWDFVEFDHAATGFSLTGAHESLTCESCHGEDEARGSTSARCSSCHRGDDVHRGEFGSQCDQCHGDTSFSELQMGRGF